MATIVEYTDRKRPQNLYPKRIISPARPQPCCYSDMEEIGRSHKTDRWGFQYKRCRQCEFTVRVIVRAIPDEALLAGLHQVLVKSFVRNVPIS